MKSAPYFWQQQQWDLLVHRYQSDALPHALLVCGADGLGQFEFAAEFAKFILCANNGGRSFACNACKSCAMFQAQNHPDYFVVQPEGAMKAIKIEAIRDLVQATTFTAHQGGCQAVIINQAEAMNIASANALLKTLEEPLGNTVIMLVSTKTFLLPATITSRCQKVKLLPPSAEDGSAWLASRVEKSAAPKPDKVHRSQVGTQGRHIASKDIDVALRLAALAPLKAAELLSKETTTRRQEILEHLMDYFKSISGGSESHSVVTALSIASNFSSTQEEACSLLDALFSVGIDLSKLRSSSLQCKQSPSTYNDPNIFITNQDCSSALRELNGKVNLQKLFEHLQELLEVRKILFANVAINKQLTLESMLLQWRGILSSDVL